MLRPSEKMAFFIKKNLFKTEKIVINKKYIIKTINIDKSL